jgi:acyl-CoA thioester hydrolase
VSLPWHHPVEVRFRDLDALGHAHHTLPLVYVEEARAAFWREAVGRPGLDGIDYVLAELEVRFHEPIFFPQRLDVGLRVSRIGSKSFVMDFEVRGGDGRLFSRGRTVQVMYDYATRSSKPVPPEVRAALEKYAG